MPAVFVTTASWRGVPFAVRTFTEATGRRLEVHQYPLRDIPFTEDLGRSARRYRFSGYLVSNDLVYGGGDVSIQRRLIKSAAEQAGSGVLVHPTLGRLTVNCESVTFNEDLSAGTYLELDFAFVESGAQSAPSISTSTGNAVLDAITGLQTAAQTAFSTAIGVVTSVAGQVEAISTTALQFVQQTGQLGQDATSLLRMVSVLPGSFGRYIAGANLGLSGILQGVTVPTTVDDLVAEAAADRAGISAAGGALETACADLGVSADADDVSAAAQALVSTLGAAMSDPADGLRLLGQLYDFGPSGGDAANPGGVAISSVMRRAAIAALAGAGQAYQPSSYDDAFSVLGTVTGFIDQEILVAGDNGEDGVFSALRTLRIAVVQDLQARGALLSSMTTFTVAGNLPALALAQRFYRDATRADQLVQEADPISPLFMPNSIQALAS